MKRILFVGEHPFGFSGNSHMLNAILTQLDVEKYETYVFATTSCPVVPVLNQKKEKYIIFEGGKDSGDLYGARQLISLLIQNKIDILVFIGLDCWIYSEVFSTLVELKQKQEFIWVSIFPYDSIYLRKDWITFLSPIDFPCVYSQYGYSLLKKEIANIQYFRPPLYNADKFIPYSVEEKKKLKHSLFCGLADNKFVFGFFGANQFRKDPLRMIHTFFQMKKECPDIVLYLHSELSGVFNIDQYLKDCGCKQGDVVIKKQGLPYNTKQMVDTYNSIDCLVNTSLQEGLSWTLLEAMLCKIPIIASNTTSQKELLEEDSGRAIECTDFAFLPTLTEGGPSFIETKACNIDSLISSMKEFSSSPEVCSSFGEKGYVKAKDWLSEISDINILLESIKEKVLYIPIIIKENKILFAQYSAAGDVFMTTRCLKGLKERHKNIPLVYMTSPQYIDILINNPYIEEIIPWDEKNFQKYQYVYNPHRDRIAPGHWGRNCNSILSDFYWKILMVEPDDFFIEQKEPIEVSEIIKNINLPICVLHSTGGDSHFRTYKYLSDISKELKDRYFTIQLGSANDFPADAELDLRGKLCFRESAWVMARAKIAITVDSFISHLAGALGIPQVCLFGSGNYAVVRPNQVKGVLICRTVDYVKHCKGLGPCSASIRDCPIPCTGIHNPKDILKDVEFLEQNFGRNLIEMRDSS